MLICCVREASDAYANNGEICRFSRLRLYRKIRITVSRRDIGNPRGNVLGDFLCCMDWEIKCSALGDFDESRLETLPESFFSQGAFAAHGYGDE